MKTTVGFLDGRLPAAAVAAVIAVAIAGDSPAGAPELEDIDFFASSMVQGGARDQFPAMTNPIAARPDEVTYVADDDLVLDVHLDGVARAYPENLGWLHEIINDELNGRFISVSFCPLTGSGANFDATAADGTQVEYGVSGFLLNSNLVLFDLDDDTLYPQMASTGLNGPRKGHQLEPLPVVETTWAMWKRMHPETTVPRAGTGLDRFSARYKSSYENESHYVDNPYSEYRVDHDDVPFPPPRGFDYRLRAKDVVTGICRAGQSKVYPLAAMPDGAVINDRIDDLNHVVLFDSTSQTAITYSRELDGEVLYFYAVPSRGELPLEFMDEYSGSRWNMRGEAVAGPLVGAQLEQVVALNAMWFAWAGFFRNAVIWDGEGIIEAPPTAVAAAGGPAGPREHALSQSFPNPFNAATRFEYRVPRAGAVRLAVYDLLGQRVRILVDETAHAPGRHATGWDGRDAAGREAASGPYFYRLEAPGSGFALTRRMLLLR